MVIKKAKGIGNMSSFEAKRHLCTDGMKMFDKNVLTSTWYQVLLRVCYTRLQLDLPRHAIPAQVLPADYVYPVLLIESSDNILIFFRFLIFFFFFIGLFSSSNFTLVSVSLISLYPNVFLQFF